MVGVFEVVRKTCGAVQSCAAMTKASVAISILSACVAAGFAAGCGGGQYGFAHEYEPLGEENQYMQRAVELSYEEVRRARPEAQQLVGWFGVLTAPPEAQADGTARLTL